MKLFRTKGTPGTCKKISLITYCWHICHHWPGPGFANGECCVGVPFWRGRRLNGGCSCWRGGVPCIWRCYCHGTLVMEFPGQSGVLPTGVVSCWVSVVKKVGQYHKYKVCLVFYNWACPFTKQSKRWRFLCRWESDKLIEVEVSAPKFLTIPSLDEKRNLIKRLTNRNWVILARPGLLFKLVAELTDMDGEAFAEAVSQAVTVPRAPVRNWGRTVTTVSDTRSPDFRIKLTTCSWLAWRTSSLLICIDMEIIKEWQN